MSSHTARERLRAEIVKITTDSLARYAVEFPEYAGDERDTEAVAWAYRRTERILAAIDRYEIRDKRRANGDEP